MIYKWKKKIEWISNWFDLFLSVIWLQLKVSEELFSNEHKNAAQKWNLRKTDHFFDLYKIIMYLPCLNFKI